MLSGGFSVVQSARNIFMNFLQPKIHDFLIPSYFLIFQPPGWTSVASTLKLELRVGEMKYSEKILEKIVLDGFLILPWLWR